MSQISHAITEPRESGALTALRRTLVIGLTAFLTVVDLFATQAILPSLATAYQVTPAAMGFAVNASTIGMAGAGLAVALFGSHVDRRFGILFSLLVLAIPTALLAGAPNLFVFTVLRTGSLPAVLVGLALVGGGTFFAQAVTGSWAAPRRRTKARPAASVSPAISPVGWWARRCSARPLIDWAGAGALPVLRFYLPPLRSSPCGSSRNSRRLSNT